MGLQGLGGGKNEVTENGIGHLGYNEIWELDHDGSCTTCVYTKN